jgi:hypothetical protein
MTFTLAIQSHPEAAPFRRRPFPLFDDMATLVDNVIASGKNAFGSQTVHVVNTATNAPTPAVPVVPNNAPDGLNDVPPNQAAAHTENEGQEGNGVAEGGNDVYANHGGLPTPALEVEVRVSSLGGTTPSDI